MKPDCIVIYKKHPALGMFGFCFDQNTGFSSLDNYAVSIERWTLKLLLLRTVNNLLHFANYETVTRDRQSRDAWSYRFVIKTLNTLQFDFKGNKNSGHNYKIPQSTGSLQKAVRHECGPRFSWSPVAALHSKRLPASRRNRIFPFSFVHTDGSSSL